MVEGFRICRKDVLMESGVHLNETYYELSIEEDLKNLLSDLKEWTLFQEERTRWKNGPTASTHRYWGNDGNSKRIS
jgi:hypothetical protein